MIIVNQWTKIALALSWLLYLKKYKICQLIITFRFSLFFIGILFCTINVNLFIYFVVTVLTKVVQKQKHQQVKEIQGTFINKSWYSNKSSGRSKNQHMKKTQNIIKQPAKNHLEITQDGDKDYHQCSKNRKTSGDRGNRDSIHTGANETQVGN